MSGTAFASQSRTDATDVVDRSRMSAKDYFYIALILAASLYGYRRGFHCGVKQTREIWKALLEKTFASPPDCPDAAPPVEANYVKTGRRDVAAAPLGETFENN